MKHFADLEFWKCYDRLPKRIQKQADKNFKLLKADPKHPSLQFKNVGKYWSVRVNLDIRAVAVPNGNELVWFWIGKHSDYDKLIH